jgi:hypothetical protein
MVNGNQKAIQGKLTKLKPGKGVTFTLRDGKKISVYKADKGEKGYYTVDNNRNKTKFKMDDLLTYSQILAKDPNFQQIS